MKPEELKTTIVEEPNEMIVERGSIIKTYNKAAKREFWSLVLAFNNDTLNCIKLTSDSVFSEVPEIRLTTKIGDSEDPIYVNAFGGLFNIKYDQVIEVLGKISSPEYYGVVSTIANYFLGYWYIDEATGHYRIDMPYVKNPFFTLCFGMVNIDEAKQNEVNSRLNLTKKAERDKRRKIENKINNMPYLSKTDNVKVVLNDLGMYSLETQDRINAIYRVFTRFLTPGGGLNVKMAYDSIFNGIAPRKSRKDANAITKEEFALFLNTDLARLTEQFGKNSANTKRCVTSIFSGVAAKKNTKITSEIREFIKRQIDLGNSTYDGVAASISEEFGIDIVDSSVMARSYITNNHRSTEKPIYENPNRQMDDKLLSYLDYDWIKEFDRYDDVYEYVTKNYDKSALINDGSYIVDTGDSMTDIIVLYIFFKATAARTWFRFLDTKGYERLVDFLDQETLDNIISRFKQVKFFYRCPMVSLKAIAKCMRLSKEEIKWYQSIAKSDNIKTFDPNKMNANIRLMLSSSMRYSQSILKFIEKYFGFRNISDFSNVISLATSKDITYRDASNVV